MTQPTESYLKFHYGLRPKKQIERRMIIDALHIMACAGFQIGDYQYTGFGSVYFIDFIMFHKLLGIKRMLSVEYSANIRKRVKFNCPFSNIDIKFGPISDFIPDLSPDISHLLWLDYDYGLNSEMLYDVSLSAAKLSPGSLLIITVDNEPPEVEIKPPKCHAGPKEWMEYFKEQAGDYFSLGWTEGDFGRNNLFRVNDAILMNALSSGLASRPDVNFYPIFNFLYADGHEMLTVGGVIGTGREQRLLNACGFDNAIYIRRNLEAEPYRIVLPNLTYKEKLYLDNAMPCKDGWKPREFDLNEESINAYREIYRFYPHYVEMLL